MDRPAAALGRPVASGQCQLRSPEQATDDRDRQPTDRTAVLLAIVLVAVVLAAVVLVALADAARP